MKKTPILAFSLFMGMITLKSQVLIGFETSPLASENSFWNGSDGLSNGISEQSDRVMRNRRSMRWPMATITSHFQREL